MVLDKINQVRFSEDDEEYLDFITPPVSPPHTDAEYEDNDEKEKDLWYKDRGAPSSAISITVSYPHPGRHYLMAGETVEVNVVCTVKQLQLLSGFLEGFSVISGHCEETLCFQEVLLYPHQQHQDEPLPAEGYVSDDRPPTPSKHHNNCGTEKHFRFWLTVPQVATPSLRMNAKTGIFYRIRVGGIGEVHHYKLLPAANNYPQPLHSHSHVIGGVDNYVPIKVRNGTCKFLQNYILEHSPQTSFTKSTTIGSNDIIMKAHLFGSSPYAILGQLCNFFVTIENNTDKHTKGITVKLIQSFHAKSTARSFCLQDHDHHDNEFEKKPRKTTVTKYRFYNDAYSCEPHTKKQTEVSIMLPYCITPTIITQNIQAWYTLLIRIDGNAHGLMGEMPLVVLPCTHSCCTSPSKVFRAA